ncbi:serine O-acetyltransferase [Fistulifera solaris]|uniref:serine O-acetyltransferase n=1 Tax=Fistulifera solaris TaxID=1519565 RepID=A0A1Z5KP19_FISSO|nr:serine O-acetyltransferase [Fistulifera solaris]|eukprot:GAX27875.1 serine O-acetyltransferase [Fistulifera solaris]
MKLSHLLFLFPALTAAWLPLHSSFARISLSLFGVRYKLGGEDDDNTDAAKHWMAPLPVEKPTLVDNNISYISIASLSSEETAAATSTNVSLVTTHHVVAHDETSQTLRSALWDEQHFAATNPDNTHASSSTLSSKDVNATMIPLYPDIDLSIPESVYSQDGKIDLVWDLLRHEAYEQASREPLLVSFLHSTILNHPSLESSLAFLLANRLQSPAMMISTQLQSLVLDALQHSPVFRRSLRADIMAVRDRDPACSYLPDAFLYFKGFHALQTHRVAHYLWSLGKHTQALFLQSQSSQTFQIDIHPAATLGSGILLDHGTGVVIGSTASIGHNCSILHHVTLGGSGKKGVDRHPKVGNGVLLGAGATLLGPVRIGDGCQIGAGTLVIANLPAHSVAVGVPARIIGSFIDVTDQPSLRMNQLMDDCGRIITFEADGI